MASSSAGSGVFKAKLAEGDKLVSDAEKRFERVMELGVFVM